MTSSINLIVIGVILIMFGFGMFYAPLPGGQMIEILAWVVFILGMLFLIIGLIYLLLGRAR